MSAHVTNRLSAYLDGALAASDLERVEAHLEVCGGCAQAYRELQALQRVLRGLPEPTLPAGLTERLHWRLQREANDRARDGRPWYALRPSFRLALACATLLLVLGLPTAWMADRLAPPETPLDTDAYIREYLLLSVDRPLGDEAAPLFVTSDPSVPESSSR